MTADISVSTELHNSHKALQEENTLLRQQLAELKNEYRFRDNQLEAFSAALRRKDEDYHSLFAQFPRGMQEEDYSDVKKYIDRIRSEGVVDLKNYFQNNPKILRELVESTHITNVNQAMLDLTHDNTLQEFLDGEANFASWWDDEWAEYYAVEFDALAGPDMLYEDDRADIRYDGSVFLVHTITTVVKGYEETWERVITIFDDITERKRNEKALLEAKTAAEKASLSKTEFLSSMSHELRTPLNAILGFSELFQYEVSLNAKQKSNAGKIYNAGQHLLTLIDEILDLSRIEAGRVDMSIESLPLESVIRDSLILVSGMAASRGVRIEFDPDTCCGIFVEADAIRLKQVFLNLLSNAVKYNCDNGRVIIACEQSNDGIVSISISDTGPGISSDRLGELFKPFDRLGAEFTNVEGTGIGLVITRKLVRLMQGELKVDSIPGQGSSFTIVLNSRPSEASENSAKNVENNALAEAAVLMSTTNSRILVAEDSTVNQGLLAAQMQLLGYSADYVDNGVEALKLWNTGRYHLLLTDIRMPDMEGYELIRQVRELESNTATSRIIAVTANAMKTDIDRCLESGADDVLSKPFSLEVLRQKLEM